MSFIQGLDSTPESGVRPQAVNVDPSRVRDEILIKKLKGLLSVQMAAINPDC